MYPILPDACARALTEPDFSEFDRGKPLSLKFVCFTRYKKEFTLPVAFPPLVLQQILAAVWAEHGVKNLRVAVKQRRQAPLNIPVKSKPVTK